MNAVRASEADCQRTIVDAATRLGWLVHAERPAQSGKGRWMTNIQGHAGWPDLVLVKDNRLVMVELKRRPYKVKPEQTRWHDALRAAGVVCGVVWVPEGLDRFLGFLAGREGLELA
jgi:hypothetical protein